MSATHLVIVIGAGPTGLAAAAHLRVRDADVIVLEAGPSPAAGVRAWGHVTLFSTWDQLVDDAARKLLAPTGWIEPDGSTYPDGNAWADRYLDPLAAVLGDTVRLNHRVTGIARQGLDLMSDNGRADRPFVVLVDTPDGPQRLLARAVIDASGTTTTPNPIGADGLPVSGETTSAYLVHGAPDLHDQATRSAHAGQHTVVVGAGHTAMTALVSLGRLAAEVPGTTVTWAIRREVGEQTFGGGAEDQLAGRGALGLAAADAVRQGHITVVEGFRTAGVRDTADGAVLTAQDGRALDAAHRVVVATGYRPDLSITGELRLELDPSVQAPKALGPLIDPNVHSCGSVPPHGEHELAHPERDFYTVGMKSYGRAPTFLALTGFEQVRSVAAKLTGDEEAAREVHLVLPETGVCGGTGLAGGEPVDVAGGLPQVSDGGGCCS